MEVSYNLEKEVCRAEELRRVLERCAVCVQESGECLEKSRREQPVASEVRCVEELQKKLSSLQQSHTDLLRETGKLRKEVARLREKRREGSINHNPPFGVIQREPEMMITSETNSREQEEAMEAGKSTLKCRCATVTILLIGL